MSTSVIFLHRSSGRNLLWEEDPNRDPATYVRALLDPRFELWDHDYQPDRLYDGDRVLQGYDYDIPYYGGGYHPGLYNTYPGGLHYIFTSSESAATTARNNLVTNHDIIAFKSCYPACDIASLAQLNQYKTWYTAIRNYCVTQSDKKFVLMTPPPRRSTATNQENANRAREFTDWVEWLCDQSASWNCYCFNLFDYLADESNMLASAYCRGSSWPSTDSHPNVDANEAVAPEFASFLLELIERPIRRKRIIRPTIE